MKDPAFLFYPGDYLRDTQCLSEKTQVAYDRIMCEHMRNICISQQQLNFFTKRLNDEEKSELLFLLTKKDDGYCIEWVAESIEKRKEYSKSRSKNRKKNEISCDKHMLSYDKHMENENVIENINENEFKIEDENSEIIPVENLPDAITPSVTCLSFEEFWELYDKKRGDKEKLRKKYDSIKEKDRELMKEHIPKYKASQPEKQYRKDPQTYLNNHSWNDEIIQNNGKSEQSNRKKEATSWDELAQIGANFDQRQGW